MKTAIKTLCLPTYYANDFHVFVYFRSGQFPLEVLTYLDLKSERLLPTCENQWFPHLIYRVLQRQVSDYRVCILKQL